VRSECLEPVGHELSEGYEGERVQDEHEHKRQAHAFNDRRGFGEVEVEQPKVVGHAVVGERDSAEEHAGADEQEQAERPHPHEGSAARAQATDAQSNAATRTWLGIQRISASSWNSTMNDTRTSSRPAALSVAAFFVLASTSAPTTDGGRG
jgi:hypothetical protein